MGTPTHGKVKVKIVMEQVVVVAMSPSAAMETKGGKVEVLKALTGRLQALEAEAAGKVENLEVMSRCNSKSHWMLQGMATCASLPHETYRKGARLSHKRLIGHSAPAVPTDKLGEAEKKHAVGIPVTGNSAKDNAPENQMLEWEQRDGYHS